VAEIGRAVAEGLMAGGVLPVMKHIPGHGRATCDSHHGLPVVDAPVLDVPAPGSHDIIGDRAYGTSPERVAEIGRAVAEGLMAGGVLPVMKHIPGHGRATC
ncbi:beta-hexosaminidase, partial [Methylobacterium radiotolerans]